MPRSIELASAFFRAAIADVCGATGQNDRVEEAENKNRAALSPRYAFWGPVMSLGSVSLFKGMSAAELGRLELGGIVLEPRDRASIFMQGDPADAVYAIIAGDGHVRIGAVDRQSKALMVEVFRAGETFGEIGVIDGGARTASAVAEGNVRLMKIRASAFLAALADNPGLGESLCRMMARRLRRT